MPTGINGLNTHWSNSTHCLKCLGKTGICGLPVWELCLVFKLWVSTLYAVQLNFLKTIFSYPWYIYGVQLNLLNIIFSYPWYIYWVRYIHIWSSPEKITFPYLWYIYGVHLNDTYIHSYIYIYIPKTLGFYFYLLNFHTHDTHMEFIWLYLELNSFRKMYIWTNVSLYVGTVYCKGGGGRLQGLGQSECALFRR